MWQYTQGGPKSITLLVFEFPLLLDALYSQLYLFTGILLSKMAMLFVCRRKNVMFYANKLWFHRDDWINWQRTLNLHLVENTGVAKNIIIMFSNKWAHVKSVWVLNSKCWSYLNSMNIWCFAVYRERASPILSFHPFAALRSPMLDRSTSSRMLGHRLFSRPYFSKSRAIGMVVVVCLSVCPSVCSSRMYCD